MSVMVCGDQITQLYSSRGLTYVTNVILNYELCCVLRLVSIDFNTELTDSDYSFSVSFSHWLLPSSKTSVTVTTVSQTRTSDMYLTRTGAQSLTGRTAITKNSHESQKSRRQDQLTSEIAMSAPTWRRLSYVVPDESCVRQIRASVKLSCC